MSDLIDAEGENRAVRAFLLLYGGSAGVTTTQMRRHMEASGYPLWPEWAAQADRHLTKGGAQDWLRHLFALEVSAQPAQAEAVPQAAEFCWLVEHFDGDGTGNSTGHYYTGKIGIADRVLTTMDANEAKRYDTWREANLASVKLGSTLTGTWRAVQHGFHTIPQQAEAVPLFAALKVEGPRFHCAKVYGRIYQVLAVGSNKEDLLTVARLAKDAYYKQFPGTHEYKEPPFEWVVEEVPTAQPKFQPTEAVPPDVVRDAERYRWWRDNACRKPAMVAALLGPLIYPQDIDAMIDAAIAQQKGQT